ncbi:MAG: RHS repeat protein, partial [Xanthomonadales bacterium]|nr:RHS repeat protein [Xanthomonadales bacterium]
MTSLSDGSGSTAFRYDIHGRVIAKAQTVGAGSPKTLETSYLPNGQTEGHVLPSGAVVRYSYRADGRMLSIRVNGVEILRQIDYFAFGEAKSWQYGAADSYQRSFDLDGRVKEHTAGPAIRTLGFDPASRIRSQTDSAGGPNQWAYDYDNLDRLETATNAGTQGAIANLALGWDYDPTGNRTQETRGVNPPVPYVIAPTSNRLSSVNALSRQYDAVGNTLNDGAGLTSVYNARNRLIQTTKAGLSTHYAHNAFGERVCKASSGPNCAQSADRSEYVYDDDGHLIGEYPANPADSTEILWLDDTPVALLKRRPGSSDGGPGGGGTPGPWSGTAAGGVDVYYIHPDHLDTPRVIVNADNQPIWRWDSAPFGDTDANEQPTGGLPRF